MSNTYSNNNKEELIGEVLHYFAKPKVAVIKFGAPLSVGEKIRIKGGEVDFTQKVKSMEMEKEKIEKVKKGDEAGLQVDEKVREGYKVFRA